MKILTGIAGMGMAVVLLAAGCKTSELKRTMLASLSSDKYQSREVNNAFLLHSTGHKPNGGEIDASIIYADYYYLEALLRLKKIKEGGWRK